MVGSSLRSDGPSQRSAGTCRVRESTSPAEWVKETSPTSTRTWHPWNEDPSGTPRRPPVRTTSVGRDCSYPGSRSDRRTGAECRRGARTEHVTDPLPAVPSGVPCPEVLLLPAMRPFRRLRATRKVRWVADEPCTARAMFERLVRRSSSGAMSGITPSIGAGVRKIRSEAQRLGWLRRLSSCDEDEKAGTHLGF